VQLKQLRPSELTVQDVLECFPSSSLRPYQKETVEHMVEAFKSGKKCVILTAPTGFGKSYVNASFASVTRSFYATPQLALIDQMLRDPSLRSRFVEIKGRRNYPCYYEPQRSVHMGRCVTEDYACKERFEVCPYWVQKAKAIKAPSVLLSFAYLVAEGQTEGHSESYLGTRTLLVLDEAHNIEEECLNHVSVNVTPFSIPHEVYNKLLPQLREVKTLKQLDKLLESIEASLKAQLEQVRKIAETTGLSVMQAEDKERIERYLETYGLYKSSKSEWVWQIKGDQLFVQPLFAREFMKELIWKRAEHYIISSATILNPQEYIELIGLHDLLEKDEICILPQVPSTFPVENRPVIDRTVGPLSRAGWEENMPKAVRAVEEILREERGNVAIHCHSYDHQKALFDNLPEDLRQRLIIHTRRDREERLREWMQSRGKVFVSVAFNEGQDWKYDVCDAQILLKVPFPDLGDKRVKRRLDMGHQQWYNNQAMLEVIQAYGRAVRAEDDKARFYIVDGSFQRLVGKCWQFIPDWFKEALPASFAHSRRTETNCAAP
jgi:Rad3-related DNA helicase